MDKLNIGWEGSEMLTFERAKALADAAAEALLEGEMLLSFYDRDRNLEAPAGVSECHEGCDIPGWLDYAANHEGKLVVDVERGRFVFCYRSAAFD